MINMVQMPRPAFRKREGFTLVELLVVLAIISILSTLSIVGLGSLLVSNHMNEATAVVQGQLELARQTAKTLNRSVQLRLYQEPSTTSAAASPVIDRMQIVVPAEPSTTETDQAIEKPISLPQGVIIADGANDLKLADVSANGPMSVPFNPALPANYKGCYVLTFSPAGAVTTTDKTGVPLSPGSDNNDTVYWQLSPVPETQYRAKGSSVGALQNYTTYATFYLNSINGTYSCTRP